MSGIAYLPNILHKCDRFDLSPRTNAKSKCSETRPMGAGRRPIESVALCVWQCHLRNVSTLSNRTPSGRFEPSAMFEAIDTHAIMGSGDSPRVGIFRRHPERIFQWAENRSVPAENNISERGVRRTVIARKVCVRWTRASASLTCSSRCRHTD